MVSSAILPYAWHCVNSLCDPGATATTQKVDKRLEDLAVCVAQANRSWGYERIVGMGECTLRHVLAEYVEHFHQERDHQGGRNVFLS
jgi:hypothetical protein